MADGGDCEMTKLSRPEREADILSKRIFLARRVAAFWKLLTDFWSGKSALPKTPRKTQRPKSCACPPGNCREECMSMDLRKGIFKRFLR